MSDMNLNVDVTATTGKLEKGLQKVEARAEQAGKKMKRSLDSGGASAKNAGIATEGFADKAAKGLAKVGLLEAGVKGLGVAVDGTKAIFAAATGDAEAYDAAVDSLANTALSLPFGLGAVAGAIEGVARSIMGVAEAEAEAAAAFEKLAEIEKIANSAIKFRKALDGVNKSLADQLAILRESNEFEKQRIAIDQEAEKALASLEEQIRTFREETGRDPGKAMIAAIEEQKKQIEEIVALKKAEVDAEEARQKAEEEAAKEAERLEKIAKRQAELDKQAEEHHREMLRIEKERVEEAKKREKAEKEAAKEAEKQAKAREAFAKAQQKAQDEIAQARADAQQAVAGATATFSTAGGSFTTGVSAQVNEQKILNKISQQSRDFLAQIVQNTATLGGVGFA